MSFFDRILGEDNIQTQEDLIQSITRQIAILFANRNDKYWAYNFKEKEIMPLHELFLLDYLSSEFTKKLGKTLEVFDTRLIDVKISSARDDGQVKISIDANAIYDGKKIKLPVIKFVL